MRPRPFRVMRVRREGNGVKTLELEATRPGEDAHFAPGQFNMLYAFGVGEVAISMSGDPARADRIVHTVRAAGAGSAALCALRPGATVGVRGPFGRGWPAEAAYGGDLLLVAGGIGLAPLRPVLYRALAERERFGRIMLACGARSPDNILYHNELRRWARGAQIEVEVIVDHAEADWKGHVGMVTLLLPRLRLDPARTTAMVCGPELMMRFTGRDLVDLGIAPERIWLSLERNMKCAVALCGHCQLGPAFVCRDGPVMRYDTIADLLAVREL